MKKFLIFSFVFLTSTSSADPARRYFLEGDGSVALVNAKTGERGQVVYRLENGSYPRSAWGKIDRIFGVPKNASESISPRLVALLDYLQDYFKGGPIRILSGYRSPEYNENLRRKKKLAARTSLHIEGMAADIEMPGVKARKLWMFVRDLNCCGAGYYHGNGLHLDTGPTRFWDEKSTKVEEDLGGQNKLILLRTHMDVYLPGESVTLFLARITDYPFGIRPQAVLLEGEKGERVFESVPLLLSKDKCVPIKNRAEARTIAWKIPEDFNHGGKIRFQIDFCDKPYPAMPDRIASNPILIVKE